MLAKKYRIIKEDDFDKVKKEGKLVQKALFGASILKRGDEDNSKFGFIVSTKISKFSTHRNRIKRAMHEAVRHSLNRINDGFNVLFLAKKSILKASTEEIMREVKELLEEGGITK